MFDRPPYKRRTINLIRPSGYRSNQGWQDWRAMKFIAARPIPPVPSRNIRTGGFLGKELKFVDYNGQSNNTVTSWQLENPTVGCLNAIAQGDGESQRIGRKVTNRSVHVKGYITLGNSNTNRGTSGAVVRIVLFKDTQTNGAAPTPTDVMTPNNVNAFRNLEYTTRYQVLYDKTFTINPSITHDGTKLDGNYAKRPFSINCNLSDTTTFDGTTADISDIVDNSYHLIASAFNDGGPPVYLVYQSRFRYMG